MAARKVKIGSATENVTYLKFLSQLEELLADVPAQEIVKLDAAHPMHQMNRVQRVLDSVTNLVRSHQRHEENRHDLLKFLEEHAQMIRRYHSGTIVEKLKYIVLEYKDHATKRMNQVKNLRDKWMLDLTALNMLVETAGMAVTHGEKNARLRGLCDLINNRITNLDGQRFDLDSSWWRAAESFRTDYPTREMAQRIRQLEQENQELQDRLINECVSKVEGVS